MNTIEQRLDAWSGLAANGVSCEQIAAQPDYDVYRRAFRLKRFGRCPCCDEKAMSWTSPDFFHMGRYLWCGACRWSVFIWDSISLELDELILGVVRGAPLTAPQRAAADEQGEGGCAKR